MFNYFIIAMLSAYMLRLIGIIGINNYFNSGKTDEELSKLKGFQFLIYTFAIGTVIKYATITIFSAYLIKKHLLT